jgi:hypothetical protein
VSDAGLPSMSKSGSCRQQPIRSGALRQPDLIGQWRRQNKLKPAIGPFRAEPQPGRAAHINCEAKTIEPLRRRI